MGSSELTRGTTLTQPDPSEPLLIWIAYNDASNAGDHASAARYVAADLTVLVNGRPVIASVEEDRAIQQELIECYPDYARSFDDGFQHGDQAIVEWRMRGTPTAASGLPRLDMPGCSVIRCRDNRIVQARLYHPVAPGFGPMARSR